MEAAKEDGTFRDWAFERSTRERTAPSTPRRHLKDCFLERFVIGVITVPEEGSWQIEQDTFARHCQNPDFQSEAAPITSLQ